MVYQHKIPVKNIFYMLCYAWDTLDQKEKIMAGSEDFNNIYDLLASVYITGCKNILKRGLNKNYVLQCQNVSLVRGKIDFTESNKPAQYFKKSVICHYDEFLNNMILNQIIVSTIILLLKYPYLDKELKNQLKRLRSRFNKITPIKISKSTFSNLRFNRNNYHYKMLINISELIFMGLLVNESQNEIEFSEYIKDIKMANLFEKFILNYYKKHLPYADYKIHAPVFEWKLNKNQLINQKSLLPIMRTDIVIEKKLLQTQLIIDAKYYAKTLVMRNHSETEKIRQSHIYQIYAYTQNSQYHGQVNGMLLYPTTEKEINAIFPFEKQNIYIKTINLNTAWQDIENRLNSLIGLIK